jgi:REP element-mobilizing transposase RayT
VFGTKNRAPLITPEIREPLYAYLAGVIDNIGGRTYAIGGTVDHVHILAELGKSRLLQDYVRDIKANSSRWVRSTYPDHRCSAWQKGAGVFTVGVKSVPQVKAYIDAQDEHHRTESFGDEFVGFLRWHGIAHDPGEI